MTVESVDRFPTTSWGLLQAVQGRGEGDCVGPINRLIAAYWRPVFFFVRARGCGPHEAEDLTQEFFLQMLTRDWLRRADPSRGRFRNFLLAVLVRFLSDQGSGRAPRQQTFDQRLVSISALINEDERAFEPAGGESPEQIFMKHWARSLLDEVLRRVEAWCREQGRPDWYLVFTAVHFPPPGERHPSKQAVADRFRLTRDQVRYAVDETNRRFVELLRSEVAAQVAAEDVEQELRELESLLAA